MVWQMFDDFDDIDLGDSLLTRKLLQVSKWPLSPEFQPLSLDFELFWLPLTLRQGPPEIPRARVSAVSPARLLRADPRVVARGAGRVVARAGFGVPSSRLSS